MTERSSEFTFMGTIDIQDGSIEDLDIDRASLGTVHPRRVGALAMQCWPLDPYDREDARRSGMEPDDGTEWYVPGVPVEVTVRVPEWYLAEVRRAQAELDGIWEEVLAAGTAADAPDQDEFEAAHDSRLERIEAVKNRLELVQPPSE